eukprot:m.92709 g.92709  ORF g.92709 m.92709 type:complete len:51 (-) comp21741_c1_seq2:84-236(-)
MLFSLFISFLLMLLQAPTAEALTDESHSSVWGFAAALVGVVALALVADAA